MITLTAEAAKQIHHSAKESNLDGLPIRFAGTKNQDGSIHYGMGFDDSKEDDISVATNDIEIIVSATSAELLKDTTIDFVEIEPEKSQFIFLNPNDPNYKPPSE